MVSGGNEGSKEKKKGLESKVYSRKSFKGLKNSKNLPREHQQKTQEMISEELNASDNFSGLNCDGLVGKSVILPPESRVTINLSMKSKKEARELRRKLEEEKNLISSLMKKIEANEKQKNEHGNKVGPARTLKPSSLSVVEDSEGLNEQVEKEKRTPKANKLYRNSEFLLAKDKFPSSESNKKLKPNGKKEGETELGNKSRPGMFTNQLYKSCSSLLERLMKHKHGWVFNKPVDTVTLGLHDYFEIIKNPMDLGTVKARLNQKFYKSPVEFAEDVRLTFRNAMTYNPKEQDVYMMAEQLSKIFEDKWSSIEADYTRESKLPAGPTSPMSNAKRKSTKVVRSGRIASAKKPKAKDPNKREMTFEEKQNLSINLQGLPSEKLENVVNIIKKRNPTLAQCDDEIEVDIDVVDTETLWELDRFISNYKKSLSKNKRKAEIAAQLEVGTQQNPPETIPSPVVAETPKEIQESKAAEKNVSSHSAQSEKPGDQSANLTANANVSSPNSGSSPSDSDSDSTSGSGSDARRSPSN